MLAKAPALFVSFLLVSTSDAQTTVRTWVSATGNDSNACSRSAPCRNFGAAIDAVSSGGEVVVLDSGGFGPVSISKSVSVISPPGIHAAIAPTSGNAIGLFSPGTVILRGLYLNSQGADIGVLVNTADVTVHLENMVISGFSDDGVDIRFGQTQVFVKDSILRGCAAAGIRIAPSGVPELVVSVDATRIERNGFGLIADSGSKVSIRGSLAAGNLTGGLLFRNLGTFPDLEATVEATSVIDTPGADGVIADNGAHVTIRDSTSSRNLGLGFHAFSTAAGKTSEMVLINCVAAENGSPGVMAGSGGPGSGVVTISHSAVTNNPNGIVAGQRGTVRMIGNTITKNAEGVSLFDGGVVDSGGHNFIFGNTVDVTGGTLNPVLPQ